MSAAPSILSMELDVDEDSPLLSCQPLCGFVVIKALDEEGRICYHAAATANLKSVECLGMAEYAVLKLRHGLMREFDEEDE